MKHLYDSKYRQCPICLKQWNIDNKEHIKERRKLWEKANPEKSIARIKRWQSKNKESINASARKRYQKDPSKKENSKRKWYDKNPNYANKYFKNRRATDDQFRISGNLRSRLRKALRQNYKNGSAIKDLGLSIEEFMLYMESKFQPGMSWDNYGPKKDQWSIDHIVALSTVNLNNRDSFLMVNHYTNLRPLWNKDQTKIYFQEQKNRKKELYVK